MLTEFSCEMLSLYSVSQCQMSPQVSESEITIVSDFEAWN